MSAPSKRQQIIAALIERCRAIQIINGFNTDAGLTILAGETPVFGPDDPQAAIAIVPGGTQPNTQQLEKVVTAWLIEIQAITTVDQSGPVFALEALVADIKRAVELEDRTLGKLLHGAKGLERGPDRVLERTDGAPFVGVGLAYIAHFNEVWGDP